MRGILVLLAGMSLSLAVQAGQPAPDADALLQQAFDNWRGDSSYTEVSMTVHRPDWERSMQMQSWTRGDSDALVRFTAPAKDAGNATLKLGEDMWIFNPRLNQIVKLPASMMAQSWMGSDFSYNDLAKANDLLTEYSHKLIDTAERDGHKVFTIEALPKEDAATVWGKQVVAVRDDGVLLSEAYYDQDMQLVKAMHTDRVGKLGNRPYPVSMTMRKAEEKEKWTRIDYQSGQFDVSLPDSLFTRSNLRNPRDYRPGSAE